jgi:hypothetical protein
METTGFAPPSSAETSGQTTSSGSYPYEGAAGKRGNYDSALRSCASYRADACLTFVCALLKRSKLKELEVLEAEANQRLAVLKSARASRASSTRSGEAAASSGNVAGLTQSGRVFVFGKKSATGNCFQGSELDSRGTWVSIARRR